MLMRTKDFLNGGFYRNICLRLKSFVKNAKKNFLVGNVKIGDSVQINAGTNFLQGTIQEDGGNPQILNVQFVRGYLEFKIIESDQEGENIVLGSVMEKTNLRNLLGETIPSTLMEELRDMLKHFIILKSGESYERKSMKEIIGLAKRRSVGRGEEHYMPIIRYQSEKYVKTPWINQTLSPCVENVIVLNNRQEVQNGFSK